MTFQSHQMLFVSSIVYLTTTFELIYMKIDELNDKTNWSNVTVHKKLVGIIETHVICLK